MAAIVYVFMQPGCSACHDALPKIHQLARRNPSICFYTVNVLDHDPKIQAFADRLKVDHTPTVVVMRHGRVVYREVGVSEGIERAIR